MARYRKKPVVIEAVQWTGDNEGDVINFAGESLMVDDFGIYIHTLEGWMIVRKGDYIIKGVRGEFYSCREDIFLETYEKA